MVKTLVVIVALISATAVFTKAEAYTAIDGNHDHYVSPSHKASCNDASRVVWNINEQREKGVSKERVKDMVDAANPGASDEELHTLFKLVNGVYDSPHMPSNERNVIFMRKCLDLFQD